MATLISPPPKKDNDRFDDWLFKFWTLMSGGSGASGASSSDAASTVSTNIVIAANTVHIVQGRLYLSARISIADTGRLALI